MYYKDIVGIIRIYFCFCFGFALFSSSCTNTRNALLPDIYEDFPVTKELKAGMIEIDTALFRYPFRIRIQGDQAVVMDLHGIDSYFHLFRYPEFRYMSSFGKRGESPAEILSAENMRYVHDDWWALDANKGELVRFVSSVSGDSLFRGEVVTFDKKILRVLDFVAYNDSTFIVPDYSGDSRFCWIGHSGNLLNKSGSIPSSNEEALSMARPALAQAWRSFVDYNSHNGVLATVTQLGEVLEIYNLKDSTHLVCMGPNGEPKFKISGGYGIPTGIMGFSDVQVTDSAIYTVFHGRSFREISRQKEHIDGGKYIYVFSLQGKPLCKYILDRYIYGIYVDERRRTIVATDVNSDQPIVEFRMNGESLTAIDE